MSSKTFLARLILQTKHKNIISQDDVFICEYL